MFKDGDILCFLGDSITASGLWESEVYQILRKKYKIKCYNCGVSGASANQAINYLHSECLIYNPDYVFVMYGMNDFGLWLYSNECEKTEEIEKQKKERIRLHKESYECLIKSIMDFGATPVVCLPTPYDEISPVEKEAVPYQQILEQGAQIQLEIANKYGLQVVNFKDNLKPLLGKRNIISEDRVHPNEEGYHIMAQIFLKETGQIDECDFDTPFEFEDWNKERYLLESTEIKAIRYVDLCVRYCDGAYNNTCKTNEELVEFIKEDYKNHPNKELFVPTAYMKYLDHGDKYNQIRGEVIKRTIY